MKRKINVNVNDKIYINGKKYVVRLNEKDDSLYILKNYERVPLSEVINDIDEIDRFTRKIQYHGSIVDIESYIMDKGNKLIFLETVGDEMMIKSITSVLMQGRTKQNDHKVQSDALGIYDINKAGNKRQLKQLAEGISHSILYHSPSISDDNFNVLIGRDEDELFDSFERWLEKSQPMPYPKELTKQIYFELHKKDFINKLKSFNIKAVAIDKKLFEDNYIVLQETIIDVCINNGLISPDAKPLKEKAPLPKSSYLTETQVKKIFDTLDSMPKTYELEDHEIKPIGLKLFAGNINLYIVEADIGSEDDEYESMHIQCFGYIENLSDPSCSEWSYINVRDYLELELNIPIIQGKKQFCSMKGGFEQDLYFHNMYINSDGVIGTLDELQKTA